jgi:predicted porin
MYPSRRLWKGVLNNHRIGSSLRAGSRTFDTSGTVSAPAPGTIQTKANSAGAYNDASFVVDYQFNKHFDVYAGVNYSTLNGGMASGFLSDNQITIVTGTRFRF